MNILKSLMTSSNSSLKVIGKTSGTMSVSNQTPSDMSVPPPHNVQVITYPHNYGSDNLIVSGRVTSSYSYNPSDVYTFNLPYVNSLGENLVWVEWDSTNLYIRMDNQQSYQGPGTGTWDVSFYVLIMVP